MPCSRELRRTSPHRTEMNCGVSVAMRPCQRGDDHGLCHRVSCAMTWLSACSLPLPLPSFKQPCHLRNLAHPASLALCLLRNGITRELGASEVAQPAPR